MNNMGSYKTMEDFFVDRNACLLKSALGEISITSDN